MTEPISWRDFARVWPDLAAIGHDMLYAFDVGLAFLATVRSDGGPRVHPVCPIFVDDRLYTMVIPGPKQHDLMRHSRYALHSETFPPPREDDGFYLSGRVTEVDQAFFELLVERALLTLTSGRDGFPRGSTIWKATSAHRTRPTRASGQ